MVRMATGTGLSPAGHGSWLPPEGVMQDVQDDQSHPPSFL